MTREGYQRIEQAGDAAKRLRRSITFVLFGFVVLALAVGYSVYSTVSQDRRVDRLEGTGCAIDRQGRLVNLADCIHIRRETSREQPIRVACIPFRQVSEGNRLLALTKCKLRTGEASPTSRAVPGSTPQSSPDGPASPGSSGSPPSPPGSAGPSPSPDPSPTEPTNPPPPGGGPPSGPPTNPPSSPPGGGAPALPDLPVVNCSQLPIVQQLSLGC